MNNTVFQDVWRENQLRTREGFIRSPITLLSVIPSALLYPSYFVIGQTTNIQESILLDLKQSLLDKDEFICQKLNDLHEIRCASPELHHTIQKISAGTDVKDTSEFRSKVRSHKRRLLSAIDAELHTRNPIKYKMDHKSVNLSTTMSLGGLGIVYILWSAAPAIGSYLDRTKKSSMLGSTYATGVLLRDISQVIVQETRQKFGWIMKIAARRKQIAAGLVLLNIGNVCAWGLETRKIAGNDEQQMKSANEEVSKWW